MDSDIIELTGAIYDAVIDPQLWWLAIERIRVHFGFHIAGLGATSLPSGRSLLQVSANIPAEYIESMPRYGESALELWGGLSRAAEMPVDEPVLISDVAPPSSWEGNRYYREWARPQGLVNQVALFFGQNETVLGSLGLGLHETSRPARDIDMAGLRTLAPHLRRAVVVSRILEEATAGALTFRAALDAVSSAVVLVDRDMNIVYANEAAENALHESDHVVRQNGRLQVQGSLVRGRLEEAVQLAAAEEAQLERRGLAIPARRRDGSAVVVHMMPLERRAQQAGVSLRAVAAVFIGPGAATQMPRDAMALLFGLSPAELKVLELTIAGEPTEVIADRLGVAKSTVRSHLVSIFAKTGRHSRGELMQLSREMARPAW